MTSAIYVRVSKKEQNTTNQLLELRNYCKRNHYKIYKEYIDKGISGSKSSRPALDKMLQDVRDKKFDAVIVWKYDRLGRSTIHLLQVLEEIKNKKIRLVAVSQNIDTSSTYGKFFYTIISGFAELEREMIRERILLGLERTKKEGKKLGRPRGSKDKKYRVRGGYFMRWQKTKEKVSA